MATKEAKEVTLDSVSAVSLMTQNVSSTLLLGHALEKDQPPLLHSLLQSAEFARDVGWELVPRLLPLLPESQECLLDVATLANPREIALKVAEILEEMGLPSSGSETSSSAGYDSDLSEAVGEASNASNDQDKVGDLKRFQVLLRMLCVLHPRIGTKRPSPLLLTSITGILKAFAVVCEAPAAVRAVLLFVTVSMACHAPLTPAGHARLVLFATDHDHDLWKLIEPLLNPVSERTQEIILLLRSFLTRIVAIHLGSMRSSGKSPPFAWANRFIAVRQQSIPSAFRFRSLRDPGERDAFKDRDAIANNILEIAEECLAMSWKEAAAYLSTGSDGVGHESYKMWSSKLEPSREGLLYLIAMRASNIEDGEVALPCSVSVFSDHYNILNSFDQELPLQTLTNALLDAVLLLGWTALLSNGGYVEPEHKRVFFEYLDKLNVVSSQSSCADLRYLYHRFSSLILHLHTSSTTRLEYIKGMLRHPPYANLTIAALRWFKTEVLCATNDRASTTPAVQGLKCVSLTQELGENVFATPAALRSIGPPISAFPSNLDHREVPFQFPFWIAVLNLFYVLLASPSILARLEVAQVFEELRIAPDFVHVLDAHLADWKHSYSEIGLNWADIHALEDGLDRVRAALPTLIAV